MRRRALGKGLEALIPIKEKEVFEEGYRLIPIEAVKENPYQPRAKIEESEVKDLVSSIREKGVIEPIVVKRSDDHFVLAAGERRLKAARVAGLKEIPAIIRDLSEQDLLEVEPPCFPPHHPPQELKGREDLDPGTLPVEEVDQERHQRRKRSE